MTETQKKFLSKFRGNIEISNAKGVCEISDSSNIYFLAGVKDTRKRNMDKDIVEKNYFAIDIDLRSWFRDHENSEISDEEIKDIAETLSKFLSDAPYGLSEWSYIIFSGNGLHLYYIGDPIENIDPKLYSYGVKKIYELFEDFIGSEYMKADFACRNIARILRLPDTINQKNGKKVQILYEQEVKSSLVSKIQIIGAKKLQIEQEKRIEEAKIKMKEMEEEFRLNRLIYGAGFMSKKERTEATIATINAIPAYLVSQKLLPEFTFHHNEKNFLNEKNEFTGFFYNSKTNTICNGGSHHYAWGDTSSCYSPLVLVNKFYGHQWADTFEWFKKHFNVR